jgi:hypothetical protein
MNFKKLTEKEIEKINKFAFETLGFNENDIGTFQDKNENKFNFINFY